MAVFLALASVPRAEAQTARAEVLRAVRIDGKGRVHPEVVSDINARLDTIEERLTDTQDVMIALSEKYGRLDRLEKDRQ